MRARPWLFVLTLCACDGSTPPADAGMDAAVDAGPGDAGASDAGPPWTGPGCNPTEGIECDGDWTDRCTPACAASECCAPLGGAFSCVARGEDGSCPAANIWLDTSRIGEAAVEWRYFPPDDCALIEECVDAPGWRRLLRFPTWTPNTGTADLYLGPPDDLAASYFVYSECHDHHHFLGYADYELRASDGTVAAEGHKQAFCLLDFYRYPEEDERGIVYDCDNQGIQAGYQDVYDVDLDCQWVDVTDVAPGEYTLHVELNTQRTLLESDYDDNAADVTVTIPEDVPVDVTAPCAGSRQGPDRDCGWTREGLHTCAPGAMVTASCSSACGLGLCVGDTVLRICETDDPVQCGARQALAVNDESGCSEDDACSRVTFACPAGGSFVALTGAWESTDGSTSCSLAFLGSPAP